MKTSPPLCKQLREKLTQLGILGIKLGQYMCNRSDISTPCMKNELKQLLSQNKIHSVLYTNQLLEEHGYDELEIGDIIGSGSMTQVYQCTIKTTGEVVVLKIKHPEVMFLSREIRVIKRVIYSLGYIPFFKGKIFRHMDWDEFFSAIEEQLDMNNEIRSMQMYETIYNSPLQSHISIPKMIYGTRDFIVMSFCPGKHLYEFSKEDPVYQKAHNLFVSSMIHMGFIYQFMHGDIHEGNILVKENGDISIIDFGVCMKLSMEQFM
jgi:ubiquinone biosynthesis protein